MSQASQVLTASPQFFRDVFNASPIGIVVENMEGQPLFVNPAFCAFLGFTEEELHSKHCVDFSPPEDAAKDWALFQQLRAGSIDHYQLEKRYFRRDGSLVWGSLSISLLKSEPAPLVIAMVKDITAKKEAEEARFRLAAIVESSEDAIASGTMDGIIVSWNAGAERIYGYTEAEAVGKPIAILLPPEQLDEETRILEMLRAGGRIEHFETVRVTKAGKRINVSLTISPIKDSSGKIVGCCGIARDMTERKRAEEALRRGEERLRLAQQAARIGSFEWNILTGVDSWTREMEAIHGLSPGSFGGTQTAWASLIHPEDRTRVIELTGAALKSAKPTTGEWRVVWPDGSVHWIAARWQVLKNESGEPSRVVGVNLDITDRKRAEQALLEVNRTLEAQTALLQSREEFLKVFVKSVPAAVAMLDRDMRYLQVSDRWCSENGVEASELLGRLRYEVGPEVPERWKEVNRRALEGETLRSEEDRWESGGITRWARWEVRPWKNADGTIGGILILAEDITRRKQMEDELSGMSRKLIDAQEQERARIGRDLHDDINQRLSMLAVELEQLETDPSDVSRRARELRNHTAEISSDVQALSHELHSSKLEYLGVVGGIRSWCKEFAARQKVEVHFEGDASGFFPHEVGLTLFRVLQESLHNAVKHSGVKRVEVQMREYPDEIDLTISDLGKGFDVETVQENGLGLTSMRERVRLVNGTIDILSKPMGGTTIQVRVPLGSDYRPQRAAG